MLLIEIVKTSDIEKLNSSCIFRKHQMIKLLLKVKDIFLK